MIRKFSALFAVTVVLLTMLTGCKSTLAEGIREREKWNTFNEFDLASSFTEEDGYHLPLIPWGLNYDEIRLITDRTLDGIQSYGVNGEITYTSAGLRYLFAGRKNDEAAVTVDRNEMCYMISFMFSSEAVSDDPELLPQVELAKQYREKLISTFGEPDRTEEEVRKTQNVDTRYVTDYWDYETADGKQTELQWAEAHVAYAEVPSFITLGYVWLNGAEE